MPTYEWLPRFSADLAKLDPGQRAAYLASVRQFVEDLQRGGAFRQGLRVKGVQGARGVYEMSWAPDGRATFHYGQPRVPGQAHVVWRRIGTRDIFGRP